MDPVVALTSALVDIDSTTGREADAGRYLVDHLRQLKFTVTELPVDGQRFNVLATSGTPPSAVFSTHFDCVPPFFRAVSKAIGFSDEAPVMPKGFWLRRWPPPIV